MIFPSLEKKIFKYLPKREELLLRNVLAFPKASKMGLDCSNCRSINASLFAALSLPDTSNWLSGPARKKRSQKEKKKKGKGSQKVKQRLRGFQKKKNESSTPKQVIHSKKDHVQSSLPPNEPRRPLDRALAALTLPADEEDTPEEMFATNCMICLVVSVLPAPDSPEITTD
jgi:hypothetical protein